MRGRRRLPAVAAIASVSAVATAIATIAAAAPTTTAATMAAAMATATATETTATAATAAALFLGTSLVDDEIAAAKVLAIESINRAIGFFVVGNFDESETARLAGEAITNQIDCGRIDTGLREKFTERLFRGGKRKISNVKLLHLRTPFARNRDACRGARWKTGKSYGHPKVRSHQGQRSGAPAVRGIVAEIDRFCNGKLTDHYSAEGKRRREYNG
jgi:hypothetical protein